MDSVNPEENVEDSLSFRPHIGDGLVKIRRSPEPIYLWRFIITDKNVKKVWPEEPKEECNHSDVYWAIDFNKKLISICNECEGFAYGHKVEEDE
jgi:hypothetical protein